MRKSLILLALIPCLTFAGERSLEQAASIAQQVIVNMNDKKYTILGNE